MPPPLHPIAREAALLFADQATLSDLLAAAAEIRAAGKGTVVSFSKKVFIPLTTLCRDYCNYCTFRKDPGQPGAHFMSPDEVLALAERGRRAGCQEALFSLGDQPERIFPEAREFLRTHGYARTLDYLAAMCELVLERTGLLPHANPGVMDGAALDKFKESNASVGLMLENVSVRDRKSTRLNSSHLVISYAVFCLKKKNPNATRHLRLHHRRPHPVAPIARAAVGHPAPGTTAYPRLLWQSSHSHTSGADIPRSPA